MVTIPETHKDLFEKPICAIVTTVMPDGQPQSTVVWADMADGVVRFNTARGRQKDKNLARNPMVTLVVVDPEDPFRWLEVRGMAEVTENGGREHIEQLSLKYTGQKYYGGFNSRSMPDQETRIMVRIKPTRVNAFGR